MLRAPSKRTARPPQRERGSALVLIPAVVLIVASASACVVDGVAAFQAKRSLVDAATAASNDAANALDDDDVYSGSGVHLNEALARRLALAALSARSDQSLDPRLQSLSVVTVDGRPAVRLTVSGDFHAPFGIAPGLGSRPLTVSAVSTAWERNS